MKLPVYFEAFGSIGITVSFLNKKTGKMQSMLLAECPDEMRAAVNQHMDLHQKSKNSGYELTKTGYVYSEPIKV